MEGQEPRPRGTFEFNRPTLVAALYLATYFTGISFFVGIVLAYVWRGEAEEWEATHYRYLIRTFWIGIAVGALFIAAFLAWIGIVSSSEDTPLKDRDTLMSVLAIVSAIVGMIGLFATGTWIAARCVVSIVKAMQKQAMPKPGTWWV